MKKYTAVVLDDHESVRNMLVTVLRLRGDFDVRGYANVDTLLADVFDGRSPSEVPDLVTVDLQIGGIENKGLELIEEFVRRDIPSEIVVLSGVLTSEAILEATKLGVGATIAKPIDDYFAFIQKLERMAEIGKNRRLYRKSGYPHPREMDARRRHRPVFLSYSNYDVRLATGLRRNLESRNISVWYAPTTIRVGDVWQKQIENGIDEARVFMALISDNFLDSPYCVGELLRFHRRLEQGDSPSPLILPVLADLSDSGKKSGVFRPISERYQCVDLSGQFVDGLTDLLWRVETFLVEDRIGVKNNSIDSDGLPADTSTGGKNRVA